MKVLVACEFSGIVREAFKAKGHDAWSCDLLPTEIPGQHIQGDVLGILNDGWDLMIAHPPCTFLTRAGLRWLTNNPERELNMVEACIFFNKLLDAPIDCIAVENPTQHRFARQYIRKPDQYVEPFMFGHIEHKRTWLWLKGLPLLNPSCVLWSKEPVAFMDKRGGKHYSTCMKSPGPDRWKNRSRAFVGFAQAMANQWGNL
jgi:hypothetical protein